MVHKLAYVRLYFMHTHEPEALFYDEIPGFDVIYVGYTGEKIPGSGAEFLEHASYAYIDFQKLLPDFLANLITRQPPSAPSFVVLKNLEKCLRDVDIIFGHEVYSFLSHQCVNIAMKMGKKSAVEVWETLPDTPVNFFPPYSWNVRKVKKCANLFITHTKRAKNYLRRLSVPNEKIKMLYPGVDLNVFSPPKKKKEHENLRILFVGRFDKEKGLPTLLVAFARLYKNVRNVELWIRAKKCASQIYRVALEASRSLPIKFVDFVPYARLPKLYGRCDVICVPSHDLKRWGFRVWEEQFGYVFMEGMACGLPVVSTNCGAIPEVVGPNNLIVPQNSVDDLYLALRRVIEDEEYRRYVAKANRLRAERLFDVKKQKTKLVNIFKSLVE